jgi:hypothetical protein
MGWTLSRFRAGDAVEVRNKEEILRTLDPHGCVDGMPFMPEMLQYCGKRFRVAAVAHKTCDTIYGKGGRRLRQTVHLAGIRCDGSAHDGCQADCTLFWKDAWLKPVTQSPRDFVGTATTINSKVKCTENDLFAHTRQPSGIGEEPRYVCQATNLLKASEPLARRDIRQYLFDVISGNHSVLHVFRVLCLAGIRRVLVRTPVAYRLLEAFYNTVHRVVIGRPSPWVSGTIPSGTATPTGHLSLRRGEYVRIKEQRDIEATIDESGKNRGLSFDKEMASYCGSIVSVRGSINKIVDEVTGRMRHMKQPCITLEEVVCKATYTECKLLCPRAIPPYWREIWLERVSGMKGDDGTT